MSTPNEGQNAGSAGASGTSNVAPQAARVRALLARWDDDDMSGVVEYPEGAFLAEYMKEMMQDALPALLAALDGGRDSSPSGTR